MTLHDIFVDIKAWAFFALMLGLGVPLVLSAFGAFVRLGSIQQKLDTHSDQIKTLYNKVDRIESLHMREAA